MFLGTKDIYEYVAACLLLLGAKDKFTYDFLCLLFLGTKDIIFLLFFFSLSSISLSLSPISVLVPGGQALIMSLFLATSFEGSSFDHVLVPSNKFLVVKL